MSNYQPRITDSSLLPASCSFLDFTPDSDEESDMTNPSVSSRQSKPKALNLQKQYIYHTTITPTPAPLLSPTWKSERRVSSDTRSIASSSTSRSSFTSLEYNTFKSPYTPLHEHLNRSTSSSLPGKRNSSQTSRIRSPPQDHAGSSRLISSGSSISASSSCFTIPEATTFSSPYSSLLLPSARRQSTGGFAALNGPKLRRSISSSLTTQTHEDQPNSFQSTQSERNLREDIPTIAFAKASPNPIHVESFQQSSNQFDVKDLTEKEQTDLMNENEVDSEIETGSNFSRSQSFKSCSEESSFLTATAQDEIPITPLSPKFNSNLNQHQHQHSNSTSTSTSSQKQHQRQHQETLTNENVSLRKKKSLRDDRSKYDSVINWIENSSFFDFDSQED
ncbi:uncharacterized protein MELLADRAFT_84143 [Melampsora larici-populina 98AG31]|uniref:Uncharacterized protein n=1 Tax=Melampsora larici-populina (strain 98AG31 / pathotype 3-4-7) TaxID=747676 RepID=F4SBN1_MELLP|nr:uncharacterized protein MELLADRAFT_84143 [Melampsora larici-populina 98AG31]EGF97945.1 hypothetical protein MELLADRAFT_84143 [Melampsora larici-populina 98AG31]